MEIINNGLSQEEVQQRIDKGQTNTAQIKITKTNLDIFKDNVLTLFNLFNVLIGLALFLVGAYLNMAYLSIIFFNIIAGVVQEIRGRNLVNKISLLSQQKACVIREGKQDEIPVEQIVLDDLVVFLSGNQISADCVVVDGECEVNESLLTGESDSIIKKVGDKLLSGSFVVSGKVFARAEKVGAESFVATLAKGAKQHKKVNSKLLKSMSKVTKLTGFFILPIGILLFLEAYFLRSEIISDSVVSSSAALLGMLPKGLVFLITLALAAGVINLSKKKVLVQEPHAIETLANVDLLCLDKTGTITEGNMSVSDFYSIEKNLPHPAKQLINMFVSVSEDNNTTFNALKSFFTDQNTNNYKALTKVPFSSDRKWSLVEFEGMGTIVIGAPERLKEKSDGIPAEFESIKAKGKRILYAGFSKDSIKDGVLPKLTIFAAITITDPIRKNATKTLDFFKREGVCVKVISGDSVETVSEIARQAGLESYADCIDMSLLKSDEEVKEAAKNHSVFGRVSPAQKKQLITAFKEQGSTVAMIGDGVNDVLALREADCGIALSCGSEASRQVSQLVLMDSDFTSLPNVVMEGRRVVNNITKVAGIFFIKTIYSVLLSILFVILNMPFPFIPIQITFIDLAIEAYPAFFMTFERETKRLQGEFLDTVIRKATPFALMILLCVAILVIISKVSVIPDDQITCMMYLLTGFISLCALIKACLPFNKLRLFLASTSGIGFFAAVLIFKSMLHLTLPDAKYLWIPILLAALAIPLSLLLSQFLRPKSL